MLPAAYYFIAYYGSLALFGAAGFALNIVCWLSGVTGPSQRRERFFQRAIQREFSAFTEWLVFLRLVQIEYSGCENIAVPGRVIVANHPSLLDAVLVIARVPAAVCIYKPSLRRNPVLGHSALRAGYIPSDCGLNLVRSATEKISAGATLVVFPEGTRTPPGGGLGPFRPGFALIARLAHAPLQLVRITCVGGLLTKERACWKLPQLPARVMVEAGPCLDPKATPTTEELVKKVEAWFRTAPLTEMIFTRESISTAGRRPAVAS
jgi:1-acyl-sn-glycerol-3-phosphate acyltransferase